MGSVPPPASYPARTRSEHLVLGLVFTLYCILVVTGALVHEPWWDEAQAWLIARDAPLGELFTHVIRYEGHPPLWHLILAVPAKLGLPYWWLKVAGVLGGTATAFLLLYGFPRVPIAIRILAPFAFFVAYQWTVVARSYVLLAPLLLGIACIYDRRSERPGLFALLLILLSSVSAHGFAIACALAALFVAEIWTGRIPRPARRAFAAGAAAFLACGLLLVLALWPPTDVVTSPDLHSPFSPERYAQIVTYLVPELFWGPSGQEREWAVIAILAVSFLALTILVAWLVRRGAGVIFGLTAGASLIIAARYYSMWHEGIFFVLLLFATVLAFQRPATARWLEVAAQLVLVLLLLRHAQWTFQSLAYDIRYDFTGSARAAEYIADRGLDRRVIYGTGIAAVELQPYFRSNLFDNYPMYGRTYWEWSPRNRWPYSQGTAESRAEMMRWLQSTLSRQPDIVVTGVGFRDDKLYARAMAANRSYRRVASFGGYTYWKSRPNWLIAFHVFERIAAEKAAGK